jgi:hypothetical protein
MSKNLILVLRSVLGRKDIHCGTGMLRVDDKGSTRGEARAVA